MSDSQVLVSVDSRRAGSLVGLSSSDFGSFEGQVRRQLKNLLTRYQFSLRCHLGY